MLWLLWLLFKIVLIAFFFIALLYCYSYVCEYFNPLRTMPGPPFTNPIFGGLREYRASQCRMLLSSKKYRIYGKIRKQYLPYGGIQISLSDSYWMKYVLATNHKSFRHGDFIGAECIFAAIGDNGLVVTSGDKHKNNRKSAAPAFKFSTLKKLMPFMELCGERVKNLLFQVCETSPENVDIREILNKVSLDVIGLINFGHDFKESCSFDEHTFGNELNRWFEFQDLFILPVPKSMIAVYAIMKVCKYLPKLPIPTVRAAQTTNKIHELVESVIRRKMDERKQNNGATTNDWDNRSLLDFILDATENQNVDPQVVHDLLMTFLIAGHETSTLSVTWTLYLLSKHVHYQDRCREEINKFFEKRGDENNISWFEIKDIKFLGAVIKESLRLYPPVPWLNRINIVDEQIGPYHVPANTNFLIFIAEMHRHPDYWTNPDDFVPERFMEPYDKIPMHAYKPFGDGVHHCIGYQVGLVEVTYLLITLLKNFIFSIDPDFVSNEFVVLSMQPNPTIKLSIKRIHS